MMRTLRTKAPGFTAALFTGTLLSGLALSPAFVQDAYAKPIVISPPPGAPISFADLVDAVSPAVVSVNVITAEEMDVVPPIGSEEFFDFFRNRPGFEDYFNEPDEDNSDEDSEDSEPEIREGRSLGSGFFISEDGLIVTNNHVVRNATEIEVVLEDGRELEVELVGADERTDLAVLKVKEPGTYPYVEFETEAELRRGDWVLALGNPFGFGGTATAGIISADGRQLSGAGPYTDYLQIDAAINRGNSGGPTFDLRGRVVGVNTAIISPTGGSVGIGFAIKADQAKPIVDQLIQNGEVDRGWLGVSIQSFNEDMAAALGIDGETGALVRQIAVDSPARKSGINVNDIILKIDDVDMEDSTEVTRTVGAMLVGSEHKFTIWRNEEVLEINVKVGELPDDVDELVYEDDESYSGDVPEAGEEAELLGMTLQSLSAGDRRRLDLSSNTPGVNIEDVTTGTPAGRLGLSEDLAILEVNFQDITSPEDFRAAVEDARSKGRDSILISVRVNDITSVLPLDISK